MRSCASHSRRGHSVVACAMLWVASAELGQYVVHIENRVVELVARLFAMHIAFVVLFNAVVFKEIKRRSAVLLLQLQIMTLLLLISLRLLSLLTLNLLMLLSFVLLLLLMVVVVFFLRFNFRWGLVPLSSAAAQSCRAALVFFVEACAQTVTFKFIEIFFQTRVGAQCHTLWRRIRYGRWRFGMMMMMMMRNNGRHSHGRCWQTFFVRFKRRMTN